MFDHPRDDRGRVARTRGIGLRFLAQFAGEGAGRIRRRGSQFAELERLVPQMCAQFAVLAVIGAEKRCRAVRFEDVVGFVLLDAVAIGDDLRDRAADRRSGIVQRDIGERVVLRRRGEAVAGQEGQRLRPVIQLGGGHRHPSRCLRP
tara:strand:- start:317 stop:757 length:441 start_codon:yes stop_codon:yes gene_type:complete